MFEDTPRWWFISRGNQPVDLSKSVSWLLFNESCHWGFIFELIIVQKCLLLLNFLFFINVFELALSADHHPTSTMIVQGGGIFFHLEMPVNLSQYRETLGVFNDRNLITNKRFCYFTESNSVGIILLFISAIHVMVFFFFMFLVSKHQKNRKIRFKLILLPLWIIGFCLYYIWLHIHLVNLSGVVEKTPD